MRLVLKLTVAIVAAMCVVLAARAYTIVQHEAALIESLMHNAHELIGDVLSPMVSEEWRANGETHARQLVERLNQQQPDLIIRWVWLDAEPTNHDAPHVTYERIRAAQQSSTVVSLDHGNGGERRLYTYVPVRVDDPRTGALELSESLAGEAQYIRSTILRTVATGGVVAALSGVIALVFGVWMVARPMRSLVDKARRVGQGDLSRPLTLQQRDEIGELATEMNAMVRGLARMNEVLQAEVAARIAALGQLRHADRLATVGKLASGIAHELGTPLNVVSGRAKMIAAGEVTDDEAVENARIIVDQSERMSGIVRQLLDFAGRRNPTMVVMNGAVLVRQVLSMLAPLAAERDVTLSMDRVAEGSVVEGDPVQLQQALANLVLNGIHAMPPGGTLNVRVSRVHARSPADHGEVDGEYIRVDVSDEGSGIREEVLPHIFEPFFSTKPIGKGTGLGLSVTEGIVHGHGGWIVVDSVVGQGTCFSVYLPRKGQHA